MKEYQEPTAKVVAFSVRDIVVTSGEGPTVAGSDTATEPGSIFGANGMRFD